MLPEQRHHKILDLVEIHKQIRVNDLAIKLSVSKETIRRDLASLEDRGMLRKVHGSAVYSQTAIEMVFSKRQTSQLAEKQRIAKIAAGIFKEGDSIMIQSGTTTDVLAYELAEKSGFRIITNSITIANKIYQGVGSNKIYLLGGEYNGETTYTLGSLVVEQINSFVADYAILTIGAINVEQGIMYHNHEDAGIGNAMMHQAKMSIIMTDHTKFERNALAPICSLEEIHTLIADQNPGPQLMDALQTSNVQVITP